MCVCKTQICKKIFCCTNTHKFVLVQQHELYNLDFPNNFEFYNIFIILIFSKKKNNKNSKQKHEFLKDSVYSCQWTCFCTCRMFVMWCTSITNIFENVFYNCLKNETLHLYKYAIIEVVCDGIITSQNIYTIINYKL